MKKLFLFLFSVILGCVAVKAQTPLIATLTHDGDISVFQGADALNKAYDASVTGDVITLSAGTFHCNDQMGKQITIRGAGMFLEEGGTIINTKINVYGPVTFESLCFNIGVSQQCECSASGKHPVYIKCNISEFDIYYCNITAATFIHCICQKIYDTGTLHSAEINATNSVINNMIISSKSNIYDSIFTNCIINGNINFSLITFNNCIIIPNNSSEFKSTAILDYCKIITDNKDILDKVTSSNCQIISAATEYLKEGTVYELKDDLAETWLGKDGTQVGIYGGSIPFESTPIAPRITKFNVASKTSADGKLSVDIEVEAAK